MQIANAEDVRTGQDMLRAVRKEAAPEQAAVTGNGSARMTAQEKEQETYRPSEAGLAMLEQMTRMQQTQAAKEEDEGTDEALKNMTKALRIAQNIMRGKQVPPQDEMFLNEFSSELYQAAKNIAAMRERVEEAVESELEEEDSETQQLAGEAVAAAAAAQEVPADTGTSAEASAAPAEPSGAAAEA